MFLSVDVFGVCVLTTAIPSDKIFNKIKYSGSCILDNIHAQNIELSDEDIKNINSQEIWGNNTIFLSNFENTLESGTIQNSQKPITGWRIKRKEINDTLYKILATQDITESNSTYIDRTPKNKTEYIYAVHPVADDDTEGNPTEGVEFVDFFGWILSDDETTYKFDIEIVTDTVQTVDDVTEYENFTEFNVVSFGNRRFDKGGFKTIPMEINGSKLEQTAEYLNLLKDFINNKKAKLLRNSKGKAWYVITKNYSEQYMDKLSEQIVVVSFDWQEVGGA